MKITLIDHLSRPVCNLSTPYLVLGLFTDKKLTLPNAPIALRRFITKQIDLNDIVLKPGSIHWLSSHPDLAAQHVLLVCVGQKNSLSDYKKASKAALTALKQVNANSITWALTVPQDKDVTWLRTFIQSLPQTKDKPLFNQIAFALNGKPNISKKIITQEMAIRTGKSLAIRLGNMPSNICTPTYLANQARALAKKSSLSVQVLRKKQIIQLKMNAFWSVAKGSTQEPAFIILKYLKGKKTDAPIVLVGKGITFDSGGISLKPSAGMDEMKFDMCGAASVLGTIQTISLLKLPINVIGIIPACENMPSGHANKPGDVVRSMSGKTIEIVNTDAEGRLLLCDALTYAKRFKPQVVIDVATLTGACAIALGSVHSGLFTRYDEAHATLADDLMQAGAQADDTVWPMPLDKEYDSLLKSNVANLKNTGGRNGGAITAACFLDKFADSYTWAHLDIAGTAWNGGNNKSATGRPVALLSHYLIKQAKQSI